MRAIDHVGHRRTQARTRQMASAAPMVSVVETVAAKSTPGLIAMTSPPQGVRPK